MRVEGGSHKVDTSGFDYWVYHLNGPDVPLPDSLEALGGPVRDRAPVETLTQVYSALLSALSLSALHRENLQLRGLSDVEIDRRGFRTLPRRDRSRLARELVARFGAEVCRGVPGLYVKEDAGRSWWSLAGRDGLLIPVRDVAARIVAIRVRADVEAGDEHRYSYLSSRTRGGAGPGAPPHVPLHRDHDPSEVRLTEGELKADIATAVGRMLCVSIAGVSCYRSALPVLRKLGVRTVRVAFDMDWRTNLHVALALERAELELVEAGFHVLRETW